MVNPVPHEKLPTQSDHSGLCPYPDCGKHVYFNHMFGPETFAPIYSPAISSKPKIGTIHALVWWCPACDRTSIVFEHMRPKKTAEGNVELEGELLLAWPWRRPRELGQEVPSLIRELFTEGSSAEHIGALRAAAGMYRATVEAMCKELGADGGNLHKKIEDLKNKGLDAAIVQDLHDVRLTGNWSLHDGGEFTAEEVADLADLIYEATLQIYVQPAQRAALRKSRETRRSKSGT